MLKQLLDRWFSPKGKISRDDEAPTAFAKYRTRTVPAQETTIKGQNIITPTEHVYEVPLGDALLLILDLQKRSHKDYWAKRDLEELIHAMNRAGTFAFRRYY